MGKNKSLPVILALILAAGCFGGCNGSAKSTQAESTGGEIESETEKDKEVSEKELNAPVFSASSGFYSEGFELTITSANPDAKIYYTLDGSTPDANKTLYTGPVIVKARSGEKNVLSAVTGVNPDENYIPQGHVDKATVIRAVAIMPDGSTSLNRQATYFVGIKSDKYANVPIISLTTEKENLFDYETGIYVMGKAYDDWIKENPANSSLEGWQSVGNFTQRGKEWERPAMVEYIPTDGSEGFSQEVGIRIMGGASRSRTQKSFRIVAREEYGKKNIKFELFPDNIRSDGTGIVTRYKSFLIKNGGNDSENARIRDSLSQYLVSDRNFDTLESTPVVMFLDGEFWGLYTMTEDYSDNYVENNYGIDNENIVVLKRGGIEDGESSDIDLYYEMYDYITKHDMSVQTYYDKACTYIDIQSFAEYMAFNLYIYNQDSFFEDNNWEMWRAREVDEENPYADGRWRMMAYDVDFSAGVYESGGNYRTNNIAQQLKKTYSTSGNYRPAGALFKSLSKNVDFKRRMVLALCDLRNINFEINHVNEVIDEMTKTYGVLTPMSWRRFGPTWITYEPEKRFEEEIKNLKKFIEGRYDCFISLVKDAYALSNDVAVYIEASDSGKGTVMINSSVLDLSRQFGGRYFREYPITLTAVPNEGSTFVRWEVSGASVLDDTSETVRIQLDGNCKIKAIFE